jgi:hypothetical protein
MTAAAALQLQPYKAAAVFAVRLQELQNTVSAVFAVSGHESFPFCGPLRHDLRSRS